MKAEVDLRHIVYAKTAIVIKVGLLSRNRFSLGRPEPMCYTNVAFAPDYSTYSILKHYSLDHYCCYVETSGKMSSSNC